MLRTARIAVLLALPYLAGSVALADSAHFSVVQVTSGVYAVLGKNGPNNGYAHTRGDTIVYLPRDKVVITGDVLESQVPMMSSAYPVKWISALTALQQLDWNYAIPGHGAVQQGKQTLAQFATYLTDLVSAVRESVVKGMTEEQVMTSVDMRKYDQMPHYADRNPDAIERTYLEVTGKVPD